ncbi:MAG: hypothetical protein AAF346_20990 [Pseudomonadota bacterium]
MDPIERAAFIAVGRASGFAWLAIFCIGFSFVFAPPLAAAVSGSLCLAMAVILFGLGLRATWFPCQKTDMWLLLPRPDRPSLDVAQRIVGPILRNTYHRFARHALTYAVVLLIAAIGMRLLGFNELPDKHRNNSESSHNGALVGVGEGSIPNNRRRATHP